VVEGFPSMHEALHLISNTTKKTKQNLYIFAFSCISIGNLYDIYKENPLNVNYFVYFHRLSVGKWMK
jgi:hypothetical protein